ncbi:MAG: FolB domain-containing protein [Spirochaetes bacterium]|nr:FolB domain-containing protein [Spirochaetota bacterium]
MIATVGFEEHQVRAVIGANAEERIAPQPLRLSVRLDYDATAPIETDHLSDAVDYRRLAAIVEEAAEEKHHLLESLCGAIVETIRSEFPQATRIEVEARKPRAITRAKSALTRVVWNGEASKVLPSGPEGLTGSV